MKSNLKLFGFLLKTKLLMIQWKQTNPDMDRRHVGTKIPEIYLQKLYALCTESTHRRDSRLFNINQMLGRYLRTRPLPKCWSVSLRWCCQCIRGSHLYYLRWQSQVWRCLLMSPSGAAGGRHRQKTGDGGYWWRYRLTIKNRHYSHQTSVFKWLYSRTSLYRTSL